MDPIFRQSALGSRSIKAVMEKERLVACMLAIALVGIAGGVDMNKTIMDAYWQMATFF
jgi:hypothetical protein